VVQFYGIYNSPNKDQYIVTEYLNKGSLRDFLLSENDLEISDLISLYVLNFFSVF
jgi:serine/threonine protein kinase